MPEDVVLQTQKKRQQQQKLRRYYRKKSNELLSPEARSRMGNVRFAHPRLAERAEEYIVKKGYMVSEEELKDILRRLKVNH